MVRGHGEFKLVLGGKEIEAARDQEKVARTTWKGSLTVRAGGPGQGVPRSGTVRVKGCLVNEQQANPAARLLLTDDQKQAEERWALALNAEAVAERERAQEQLLSLGTAVADILKGKTDLPAQAKVRVAGILEHFGE